MRHITVATVARTRAKYVAHDLSFAFTERPRLGGRNQVALPWDRVTDMASGAIRVDRPRIDGAGVLLI